MAKATKYTPVSKLAGVEIPLAMCLQTPLRIQGRKVTKAEADSIESGESTLDVFQGHALRDTTPTERITKLRVSWEYGNTARLHHVIGFAEQYGELSDAERTALTNMAAAQTDDTLDGGGAAIEV